MRVFRLLPFLSSAKVLHAGIVGFSEVAFAKSLTSTLRRMTRSLHEKACILFRWHLE